MRTIITAFLALLVGCSTASGATVHPDASHAPAEDAAPVAISDATSDAGVPVVEPDAGAEPVDAGAPTSPVDAGAPTSPVDAGAPTSPVDASATPDDGGYVPTAPDAATGSDAGATSRPDAGPPPAPDAGPPGCARDGLEENDRHEDAVLVEVRPGLGSVVLPLTWHAGDAADWVEVHLTSPGVPLRLTAQDGDHLSDVELRATCTSGLIVCRGPSGERVGATCVTRRREATYADVGCLDPGARVEVRAGATRAPSSTTCEHSLRVSAEQMP
jgi:hypothetical protein